MAVFLLIIMHRPASGIVRQTRLEVGKPANGRVIALLATITGRRSITIQTAVTLLPIYFVAKGESLFLATATASIWLGVAVLGQLGGGFLSDQIGRRLVITASLLIGAVLFYGFLFTDGIVSLFLSALSGTALYANWSVIVVMSSEAAPSNIGTVSGFMLGFFIGVGGLAALVFGGVADMIGLHSAFFVFPGFALVAGLLALFLPKDTTSLKIKKLELSDDSYLIRNHETVFSLRTEYPLESRQN